MLSLKKGIIKITRARYLPNIWENRWNVSIKTKTGVELVRCYLLMQQVISILVLVLLNIRYATKRRGLLVIFTMVLTITNFVPSSRLTVALNLRPSA